MNRLSPLLLLVANMVRRAYRIKPLVKARSWALVGRGIVRREPLRTFLEE